jgi:hypothetical protein
MGGYGSGRQGGRVTIQGTASYVMNARLLRCLRPGTRGFGEIKWGDGFVARITLKASEYDASFELEHQTRSAREPTRQIRYQGRLTWTEPQFGGRRWWWCCPLSGQRCGRLYLPLGTNYFASRNAYRLAYQSQRETHSDRAMRRARKLHQRIGGDGEALGQFAPPKPIGMHQRTYERLVARWQAAEAQADHLFFQNVARRFGWN